MDIAANPGETETETRTDKFKPKPRQQSRFFCVAFKDEGIQFFELKAIVNLVSIYDILQGLDIKLLNY